MSCGNTRHNTCVVLLCADYVMNKLVPLFAGGLCCGLLTQQGCQGAGDWTKGWCSDVHACVWSAKCYEAWSTLLMCCRTRFPSNYSKYVKISRDISDHEVIDIWHYMEIQYKCIMFLGGKLNKYWLDKSIIGSWKTE